MEGILTYIQSTLQSLTDNTYYILVEWWFFEFIADDEIKENEQEQGAVEDRLADNLTEIDSDCPEITNCGGKLIFCLIIDSDYIISQDCRSKICLSIF